MMNKKMWKECVCGCFGNKEMAPEGIKEKMDKFIGEFCCKDSQKNAQAEQNKTEQTDCS